VGTLADVLTDDRLGRARKPVLYALVSVVAVVTGQAVLWTCSGLLGWDPVPSNVTSVAIGSIPSYVLNRSWVWGKKGKSHLWKEIVPFWGMALLGLLLSTVAVAWASSWNDATIVVSAANLAAFGVIWVGKFFVLHHLLFGGHDHTADDEVVIPA
jgi:putative flippase GtrA